MTGLKVGQQRASVCWTNAYRVIELVVDEVKCQWVGVADSIMERLEESLPPRNLVESPSILTDKGMQLALAEHLGSSGLAQLVASATAVPGPASKHCLTRGSVRHNAVQPVDSRAWRCAQSLSLVVCDVFFRPPAPRCSLWSARRNMTLWASLP